VDDIFEPTAISLGHYREWHVRVRLTKSCTAQTPLAPGLLATFNTSENGHTLSFASIMRSTSSGNASGKLLHRSACALRSMTLSAPGRGSDRCCFILIPFRFQISAILGISTAGGSHEGLIQSW